MNIAEDKKQHALVGAVLGLGAIIHPLLGLGLGVAFGVGKEIWDKVSGKGTPELADTLYTLGGNAVVVSVIVLIKSLGGL